MCKDRIINLKRICPICKCNEGIYLDEINLAEEKGNVLPPHYNIVACRKCGFAFSDMDADQTVFDNYYTQMNIYSEAEDLRDNYTNSDNTYMSYIYSIISKYLKPDARIIDIGCGGGQLMDYLASKGYKDLTGLDPSDASIKVINKKGYKGRLGSLFSEIREEDKSSYDLVISTAVVEHIYDLEKYVAQLKGYVKEKGYLFILAPAVEGFPLYITQKPNYFNQEHINYYSGISLQNLFGLSGFSRVNDNYINEEDQEKILYMMFEYSGVIKEIEEDTISAEAIKNYLKANMELEKRLEGKIAMIRKEEKPLVFWGSGQYVKQILSRYSDLIDSILYFVDNNAMKQGLVLQGREIVSPEKLFTDKQELIVCICSMLNGKDIENQIRENGYKGRIEIL